MSAAGFAGEPSKMTADTDPALEPFREQVAFLREHAAELELTDDAEHDLEGCDCWCGPRVVDVPPFDDTVPEYLVLRDGAFMQNLQDDGPDTFNAGHVDGWRDALSTAARRWGPSPEDAMPSDEDLARYDEHNRAWQFMLDMVEDVERALAWHRAKAAQT